MTVTLVAAIPPTVNVAPGRMSVPVMVSGFRPRAGPKADSGRTVMRWENSDVLPAGSVAVAVTRAPVSIVAGSVTSNAPEPEPSVVTCPEPM